MSQRHPRTRLLVAAITALLTGSLAGTSGLVLCLGANGHRAIEFEHAATQCPTLASSQAADGASVQTPVDCFDVPAAGTGPKASSSFDAAPVPMPPVAILSVLLEPTPRIEMRLSSSADAAAGTAGFAICLRSTVLLV